MTSNNIKILALPLSLLLALLIRTSGNAQDTIMYRGGPHDGYHTGSVPGFSQAHRPYFAMYWGGLGDGYDRSAQDNFTAIALAQNAMYNGGSSDGYGINNQHDFMPAPRLHYGMYTAGSGDGFASDSAIAFSPAFLPQYTMYTSSGAGDDGYAGSLIISYVPLPIDLLSFSGQALENRQALLSWEVADEQHTLQYELQRSRDSKTFSSIYKKEVSTPASGPRNYAYTDEQPYPGHNFYRLLVTEQSGKTVYSRILMLSFDDQGNRYTLYPNPTASGIHIQYDIRTEAIYTLSDIQGKVRATGKLKSGNHAVSLPLDSYPAGSYILRIQHQDGTVKVISFIKVR